MTIWSPRRHTFMFLPQLGWIHKCDGAIVKPPRNRWATCRTTGESESIAPYMLITEQQIITRILARLVVLQYERFVTAMLGVVVTPS